MKLVKNRLSLAWALLLGATLMAPVQVDAGPLKVTLCHKGNLIEVGAAAAIFHVLAHGDTLGGCDPDPPPPPPDSGGGY